MLPKPTFELDPDGFPHRGGKRSPHSAQKVIVITACGVLDKFVKMQKLNNCEAFFLKACQKKSDLG